MSSLKINILITGASGFIGSFMVDEALKRGYNVWAGVREGSSKEFLSDHRIHFIDLDYANKENLKAQFGELKDKNGCFDYIIHCAGITKAFEKSDFNKINSEYTKNLLEAIEQKDLVPAKFIFISSLSVMGKGDEVNFVPFDIANTPKPDTAYGKSKLLAEEHLRQTANLPYIILRPTGVYGPREKDYLMMAKSINWGIDIKAGMCLQQLTFVYIKDLVDATYLALESEVKNKTYLVSDGNTYFDYEYTDILKQRLHKKILINLRIPLFLLKFISLCTELFSKITKKASTLNSDKYKIMKQRNWRCNISPIQEDLSFAPKYTLEEGLDETIQWYKLYKWL